MRERASAAATRARIGELADSAGPVRVGELATRAALGAPTEGRPLSAGLRAVDVPRDPVARLRHAATLLREHRGDGHDAILAAAGVGGAEAHVLTALTIGQRAEDFSRLQHLPAAQVPATVDGLRLRGLVDEIGGFTEAGRESRCRLEARTDELAARADDVLHHGELITGLTPIATAM